MNKEIINRFWANRTHITDLRVATSLREDGRLAYDVALVSQFVKDSTNILDLGAGTCTLSMALVDKVNSIVAVDKFSEFFDLVPKHSKLKTIGSDVLDFKSAQLFDLILLFGVANYLTLQEENQLYESCYNMLENDGCFIVKNQCGVDEEVVVDGYSEKLETHYHARYPQIDEQFQRLSKFFDVEKIDIYPPEINTWNNTHFYAFVCRKNLSIS